MFISSVPGVLPRNDDIEVMVELKRCAGQATGEPKVIALLNESREVYRLIVFGTTNQRGCLKEVLHSLGFEMLAVVPAAYRDSVDAAFWKP